MNYNELVSAAKAYADRYDVEVSDNIDIFIVMAESRINRVLKTREQTAIVYADTITRLEYYPLPVDYAGMRDIQLNTERPGSKSSPFYYLNPQAFNLKRNESFSGKNYYSIIANQIQIFPTQDTGKSIEIVYYQKVPNLGVAQPINWLSISHPDIYLSGIIAEVESFVKNYDVSKMWDDKMSRSISELDNSDNIERWSGSPLEMRIG